MEEFTSEFVKALWTVNYNLAFIAVREEVHNTIKKKLKWVDFNNMSDLKALIF